MRKFLTIPNLLSVFRILLIPLFAVMYFQKSYGIAIGVIVLSGLTDVVDGYIARHFDQVTEIGKLLDPLADKLTQITVVFCITITYPFVWPFFIVIIVKELLMMAFSLVLLRRQEKATGSEWYGKLATAVFYASMFLILLNGKLDFLNDIFVLVLMAVTVICAVYAFVRYFQLFVHKMNEGKNEAADHV